MKIDSQGVLTIYPIGIDRSPGRCDWKVNEKAMKDVQTEAVYLPRIALGERLIEGPIVIRALKVQSVEEVAEGTTPHTTQS